MKFNIKKNLLARATNELMRGTPIIVDDLVICSPDGVMFKKIEFDFSKWSLLLTSQRLVYLNIKNISQTKDFACLSCKNFEINQILELSGASHTNMFQLKNGYQINELMDISSKQRETLKTSLSLIKSAELLPALIFSHIQNFTQEELDHIVKISTSQINSFSSDSQIPENLCTVKTTLRRFSVENNINEVEASIKIFRENYREHHVIIIPPQKNKKWDMHTTPLVRLHSSCFTGDVLRSLQCDCYDQFHNALDNIAADQNGGIILYLNQDGRGIGLTNKLRAYYLQKCLGLDTVEANEAMGFQDDERDFSVAANIIKQLCDAPIRLLTNNESKKTALVSRGIEIVECIPNYLSNPHAKIRGYYKTKSAKLKHKIPIN